MATLTGGLGPGVAGLGDVNLTPRAPVRLHPFFVCRFCLSQRFIRLPRQLQVCDGMHA